MPNRQLFLCCVICASVTLFSKPAVAQAPSDRDRWIVSPALGLALDGDADPSLTLAAALGYTFTPALALEGELGHVFDMAPDDADVDSSLTTVHLSGLYFFDTEYAGTPYLAGGIGVGNFSHDVGQPPASIDATEIGFNLGAGITYPLSDRAWARGDFRYFKHIDDVPSVWRVMGAVTLALGR
jgi:opacity protein-like surface antigen